MVPNGGGVSPAAALLYNNALNVGRLAATPPGSDVPGFGVAAGPLKLAQQYDNTKTLTGLFDYEVGALRPELLDKALAGDNNNVIAPPTTLDAWSSTAGMDLTPLSLRSLASLLPLDDFAAVKYPEMASLDCLVANYPSQPAALVDGRHAEGGLCGFVSGGSDSSRSASGSSPPATGSPAESSASPRRVQSAAAAPGCPCFLCADSQVSAALVPCGHNLFCKACADAVVSRPDSAERRCPVCGERASLAIRILS